MALIRTAFALATLYVAFASPAVLAMPSAPAYPPTPRGHVVDDYFGTRVPDPYRWMERMAAPQTRRWVAAENAQTRRFLVGVPSNARFRSDFEQTFAVPTRGLPQRGGEIAVFTRNAGRGGHDVLIAADARTHAEHVLLDPDATWRDGTTELAAYWQLSPDGRWLAYPTQHSGSDWVTWRVRRVATAADAPDAIVGGKDWAGIVWSHDGGGFYYGAYDTSRGFETSQLPKNYRLYFHRLGRKQRADALVYARPNKPSWIPYPDLTPDGRYLMIGAINGDSSANMLSVKRLGARAMTQLCPIDIAKCLYVANDGPLFYLLTDRGAPRGKLIRVDLREPARATTVIAQSAGTIEDITPVRDTFVVRYLYNVRSSLVAFDRNGRPLRRIALPGIGNVSGVAGDRNHRDAYISFSSMTTPPSIFRYDSAGGALNLVFRQHSIFESHAFVTDALIARAADGTHIPVFITHRRGISLDGKTPMILYGYGGFGYAVTPEWSDIAAPWLQRGGAFAIACVRGGGEFGEAWHRAGMLANKQHVFGDFAAAAHLLVAKRYTSSERLAAYGYSGGGLLVAATVVQHPALFGAAVVGAGPVDVLRQQDLGGAAWTAELGSSRGSPAQFRTLYAYAPLVHLREGVHYPATFVWTSDHDDRVAPAHSYKLAATLQHVQPLGPPELLYVAHNAGHGGAVSVREDADQYGDAESFLWDELDANAAARSNR